MEIVSFRRDEGTLKTTARGVKIGKYMAIADNTRGGRWYKIFNLISGRPVIDVRFKSQTDATEVAKWLDNLFGEYFPLWENYPDADVFSLAKWSVSSGLQVYETLQGLPEISTLEDVAHTYQRSEDKVKEWKRW